MTNYSRAERAALCELLTKLGPQAPTCCEGWTTSDLAAHLIVRERRLDAALGLLLPALSRRAEQVRLRVKSQPYSELIELLRHGPPRWSPLAIPAIEQAANTLEFFVHHEDVRRAQSHWPPRALPVEFEELLWRRLTARAWLLLRKAPVGVVLRLPDGFTLQVRDGFPAVELTGPPAELLLYAHGRKTVARVELSGDPETTRRFTQSPLGL